MDREAVALEHLGRSWDELEASAETLVREAESSVVERVWTRFDGVLWELPGPRAGDEEPMRRVKGEPSAEERDGTVLYGYDASGRIVLARHFYDHWQGPGAGPLRGAVSTESVRVADVVLRFHHERHGVAHHRVKLSSLVVAQRDEQGREAAVRELSAGDWLSANRYEWDHERLVRQVHELFERDERGELVLRGRQRTDYEYDDEGLLRVRWENEFHRHFEEAIGDSGVSWYRRSPAALREARRLVDAELPERIVAWAKRVAPADAVYGLGIVYSFVDPQLPPALGLGTVEELRQWREHASGVDDLRLYAFNPAEFRLFDPLPRELSEDPALQDAYALLHREWELSENRREPRSTLRRCAKKLIEQDWRGILGTGRDFVVFVVPDEFDEDLVGELRTTVPRDALRRLESGSDA